MRVIQLFLSFVEGPSLTAAALARTRMRYVGSKGEFTNAHYSSLYMLSERAALSLVVTQSPWAYATGQFIVFPPDERCYIVAGLLKLEA